MTGAFAVMPVDALLGDLDLLVGRRDVAQIRYRAAADIAARCGAPLWIAAVQDRLGAL